MHVQTQPGIFHIHVDATKMSASLAEQFLTLGVMDTPFNGHPEGYDHFEPNRHMTLKIDSGREFVGVWDKMVAMIAAYPADFKGYLEGEHIPVDLELEYQPYKDVTIPFQLSRRRLTEREDFRDKEIHLTFDKNRSDQRIIDKLLEMGLYGAYVEKADHTALVLTAQGDRKVIDPMTRLLLDFLEKSGGLVSGTFKDEFAIRHYLHGVTVNDLPEVVDQLIVF